MSHTSFEGRKPGKTPTVKPVRFTSDPSSSPRAAEHGAGRSKPGPVSGTRSGNPTTRGEGFGGYTDGKPIRNYLPGK
jgi:hypothetical protein